MKNYLIILRDKPSVCALCDEEFDLQEHIPKISKCKRLVCLKCLINSRNNGINYECDICAETHQIPQGGFHNMEDDSNLLRRLKTEELEENLSRAEEDYRKVMVNYEKEDRRIDSESNQIKRLIDERTNYLINLINKFKADAYQEVDYNNNAMKTENKDRILSPLQNTTNCLNLIREFIEQKKKDIQTIEENRILNPRIVRDLSVNFNKDIDEKNRTIALKLKDLAAFNKDIEKSTLNNPIEMDLNMTPIQFSQLFGLLKPFEQLKRFGWIS